LFSADEWPSYPWDTGGMYTVELYARVRRAALVEGKSQRTVAREFGLARKTVRKMLAYSVPPGYQRQQPVRRPKLGPWLGVIDAILKDDKTRPAKQRHTAKRIFERLKELPEMQRKVLALYYIEDMHLREIAEVFGLTESRICQIHSQTVLTLRASLQRQRNV